MDDDRDEIAAELERWSRADPGKPAGRKPSKVELVGQYREQIERARANKRSREEIVAKLATLGIDVSWKTVASALKPPGGKSKRKSKATTARRAPADPAGTSAGAAGEPADQAAENTSERRLDPATGTQNETNGSGHAAQRRAGRPC